MVLIVEDDPLVRAYVISCVKSLGYHAIAAANGAEAVARLSEENKIDILFTEIVMSGGTNGSHRHGVRLHQAASFCLPVLSLSSFTFAKDLPSSSRMASRPASTYQRSTATST